MPRRVRRERRPDLGGEPHDAHQRLADERLRALAAREQVVVHPVQAERQVERVGELGHLVRELLERVRARRHQHDRPLRGTLDAEFAPCDGRNHSGAHQRGFPGTGSADQHDDPTGVDRVSESVHQCGGTAFPTEEPPRILGAECGQSAIRTKARLANGGILFGGFTAGRRTRLRLLPQRPPRGQVVEVGDDRLRVRLAGLADEDLEHHRQRREARGHVATTAPVADPLRGRAHRAVALVGAPSPRHRLGDLLQRGVARLRVEQGEPLGEHPARSHTRTGTAHPLACHPLWIRTGKPDRSV